MNVADVDQKEVLTVKTENVVQIPLGLLGFEGIKQFVLLSDPEAAPFSWLQVLDDPGLAFVVVSPLELLPDYHPDISADDVAFLKIQAPEDVLLYVIVTLHGAGQATLNLKGPVVINRQTLVGKQVILANAAAYSVRHPLPRQT
jgi:flagellar assembly factor FliW